MRNAASFSGISVRPAHPRFEFDMPGRDQSNSYNQMLSKSDDIKLLSLYFKTIYFSSEIGINKGRIPKG